MTTIPDDGLVKRLRQFAGDEEFTISEREFLSEAADRLEALTRPVPEEQVWQPIETAPTDGTPLLLFARAKTATAPVVVVGWAYGAASGEWLEAAFSPNNQVGIVPTHWQPLPEPPRALNGAVE